MARRPNFSPKSNHPGVPGRTIPPATRSTAKPVPEFKSKQGSGYPNVVDQQLEHVKEVMGPDYNPVHQHPRVAPD